MLGISSTKLLSHFTVLLCVYYDCHYKRINSINFRCCSCAPLARHLTLFVYFFLFLVPPFPTTRYVCCCWLLATMTILFRANLQHFLFIIQETQAHILTTTLKLKSMRRLLLKPENHCKQ